MNSRNWQQITAPPFSDQGIVQKAEDLTRDYMRATKPDPAIVAISFDHIYENYIYPKYEILLLEDCDLGLDEQGNKILGKFDIETNTAYIDAIMGPRSGDKRRVFTCWHEVGGHGILQRQWLHRELARFRHLRYIVTTEASLDRQTQYKLDRQANLFASHVAAPTWFLQYVIRDTFQTSRPIRYIGPGKYDLSTKTFTYSQYVKDFNELCWKVASPISWRFGGLSNEALGYRLAQVRFVIDVSDSGLQLNRVAQPIGRFSRPLHVLEAVGCHY
jgi:hypothetical protein